MASYRFPVRPQERALLLAAAALCGVILAVVYVSIAHVAESSSLSVGELFELSRQLRGLVAALIAVAASSAYALWAYLRVASQTTVTVTDEQIVLRRPALPLFGGRSRETTLTADAIEGFSVGRERRALGHQETLTLEGQGRRMRLPLRRTTTSDGSRGDGAAALLTELTRLVGRPPS